VRTKERKDTTKQDNLLEDEDVDVLAGTPLLDIKPSVPASDVRRDVGGGGYATHLAEAGKQ
jgi:tRNA (Thr-GGU) A37 N-methylase